MVARAAAIWRLYWGWKIHLQGGSLTQPARCSWLLVSVPSLTGLSTGMLQCPHGMMTDYFQREQSQRQQEKLRCVLCGPEVTHHHSGKIYESHRSALLHTREATQGRNYQEVRIIGRHLGSHLPHLSHMFMTRIKWHNNCMPLCTVLGIKLFLVLLAESLV